MNRREFAKRIGFVSAAIAAAPAFAFTQDKRECVTYADICELEKQVIEDNRLFSTLEYKGVKLHIEIAPFVDERDLRDVRVIADTKYGRWCLYMCISDMFYRAYPEVNKYIAEECYSSFICNNKELEWA